MLSLCGVNGREAQCDLIPNNSAIAKQKKGQDALLGKPRALLPLPLYAHLSARNTWKANTHSVLFPQIP